MYFLSLEQSIQYVLKVTNLNREFLDKLTVMYLVKTSRFYERHWFVCKSPPLVLIMSQVNPVLYRETVDVSYQKSTRLNTTLARVHVCVSTVKSLTVTLVLLAPNFSYIDAHVSDRSNDYSCMCLNFDTPCVRLGGDGCTGVIAIYKQENCSVHKT